MLSEAFSRCLIRPANVTQDHIEEAIRSANLMLIEFGNDGVHQHQLVEAVIPTVPAQETYDLPAGTIDVWHAIFRRSDSDTPIWPMSRSDYHSIPNKTNPGRPFNYFVERNPVGDGTRTITLWPVPDQVDELRIWVWVQHETVVKLNETLGVAKEWFDAYAAALAARLAWKFAASLIDKLEAKAGQAYKLAKTATRERVDTRVRAQGYFRRGRVV
jgi:hypothetical protein